MAAPEEITAYELDDDATALEKARAALAKAKSIDPAVREYVWLLEIAKIQAEIAQAEAMNRLADVFESVVGNRSTERTDVSALRTM